MTRLLLVFTVLCIASFVCHSFSYFYLCNGIADPNTCVESLFTLSKWCSIDCCSIHDDQCKRITTTDPLSLISHKHMENTFNTEINEIYDEINCIYETLNYVYDLHKLQLNPYTQYSYYHSYKSPESKGSPFYNKWISLYINICNKSSVINTPWNQPPDTLSLDKYISKSAIICAQYNQSAICTEIGHTEYHTSDITHNTDTQLTINLGTAKCLYYKSPYELKSKDISIKLVMICDVNTYKTEIVSVEGPLFTLDQLDTNYPCSNDITIKMKTNVGACARDKIYANKSRINCPQTFNKTTQIINCTLYTVSNHSVLSGTMADMEDNYLTLYAAFGTKTQNISLDIDVKSNAIGIFNITFNITAIAIKQLNNIKQDLWRNISVYAASMYPIGPNTTSRCVYILFELKHTSNSTGSTPSAGRVFGWILLFLAIFIIVYTGYRLQDKEARKFCCVYCMKCNCMKHGLKPCMIGSYILWCDYSKRKRFTIDMVMGEKSDTQRPLKLQEMNINGSLQNNRNIQYDLKRSPIVSCLDFIHDRRRKDSCDESECSDGKKYDSTNDFVYHQQSSYAGHIGLKNQQSKSQHHCNSVSSAEDYVL